MTASEACGTPDTPRHFLCAAGAAVGPGRAGSPAVPGRPGLEVGAASGTLTPPRVGCGALQSTLTPPVPTPVTSCGSGWVWGGSINPPCPCGVCCTTWPRLLPNTTKSGRKMSQTTRAGWGHRAAESSQCLLSNWVQREGEETGKENKTQNNSFQTIAFYSMYRAQQAEHPLTAALGAGCNTDTHN